MSLEKKTLCTIRALRENYIKLSEWKNVLLSIYEETVSLFFNYDVFGPFWNTESTLKTKNLQIDSRFSCLFYNFDTKSFSNIDILSIKKKIVRIDYMKYLSKTVKQNDK